MAIIDISHHLSATRITDASYDSATGIISIEIAPDITSDENIVKELVLGIRESATGKRTSLNSPIGDRAFTDNPPYSIVNRVNSDNSASEIQIDYPINFSLFLKTTDVLTSDAVNDDD
jgi:hypothetical protein